MRAVSARDAFRALLDAEVQFIVVGGLAVNVHGLLRGTADIGLVIDEYDRAVVRELAGVGGVRIVSLATLQRMKQEAGRPQDLADLDNFRLGADRGEDPND